MNRRCCYPLPMLIAVVMLVSGCGTTKPSDSGKHTGNQPWILLTGAEVEQAKSLAMGAAVTKGWKITDTSGNKLLIRRPLSTTQAKAIAGEPVSKAAVEVRTDFDKRRAGVAVMVTAAMVADKITDKGKKSPLRIDVTDSYGKGLSHSLSALRRSWWKNRQRIATAMRPLPTRDVVSKDEDTEDASGASANGKVDVAASSPPERTAAVPSTRSRPAPVEDRTRSRPRSIRSRTPDRAVTAAAPSTPDRPMTAVAPSTSGGVAPIEDRILSMPRSITPNTLGRDMTTPAPVRTLNPRGRAAPIENRTLSTPRPITPGTVSAAGPTDVPALDPVRRAGAWAYHAERYARTHGCKHSDGRTTLEYKHPEFEVHRIRCTNGRNLLLRCSAGSCIKLKES